MGYRKLRYPFALLSILLFPHPLGLIGPPTPFVSPKTPPPFLVFFSRSRPLSGDFQVGPCLPPVFLGSALDRVYFFFFFLWCQLMVAVPSTFLEWELDYIVAPTVGSLLLNLAVTAFFSVIFFPHLVEFPPFGLLVQIAWKRTIYSLLRFLACLSLSICQVMGP